MLAPFRKIGGLGRCWRLPEKQADQENVGALQKNRRIWKILADSQNIGGFPNKILADFQNIGGFPKYLRIPKSRRLQKIRRPYCLGSEESPADDFLLVWLKSSHSDPRRCDVPLMQSVRDGLPARSFYLCALSRTVPAACTGPTCQNCRENPKTRRKSKI